MSADGVGELIQGEDRDRLEYDAGDGHGNSDLLGPTGSDELVQRP